MEENKNAHTRIPKSTYDLLEGTAKSQSRSISNVICVILRKTVTPKNMKKIFNENRDIEV